LLTKYNTKTSILFMLLSHIGYAKKAFDIRVGALISARQIII